MADELTYTQCVHPHCAFIHQTRGKKFSNSIRSLSIFYLSQNIAYCKNIVERNEDGVSSHAYCDVIYVRGTVPSVVFQCKRIHKN